MYADLQHEEKEWEAVARIVESTGRIVVPENGDLFGMRPMPIHLVQQSIMSVVFLVDLYKNYAQIINGNHRRKIEFVTKFRLLETQFASNIFGQDFQNPGVWHAEANFKALKWIVDLDLDHEFLGELDKDEGMWELKEWIDEEYASGKNSIMIEGVQFTRLDEREWNAAMKEAAGQRWTTKGGWE